MNSSAEAGFESKFEMDDAAKYARTALFGAASSGAASRVVNRTHRVVRERAKLLQAKRTRERSLMAPLLLCSVLLVLCVVAVWSGLYQYQAAGAAEAVQADVAALAAADADNHFLVVLLWFVPVSVALLAAIWVRRSRGNADGELL